jgi:hypothetical protein
MKTSEHITNWIEAWNSHDLNRILSHYADGIEFTVQTAVTRWNKPDGVLKGKEELKKHFEKGLELAPKLHFELEKIFWAPNGYAVLYRRENGNGVIDAVQLNDQGLAVRVTAYYLKPQP